MSLHFVIIFFYSYSVLDIFILCTRLCPWSFNWWCSTHYFTQTVIIDGRDGSILWNLTTNKYDVSSDLVARTTARNRDVFIFRAQGREGHDLRNTGAIHGATGIQRIVSCEERRNQCTAIIHFEPLIFTVTIRHFCEIFTLNR
jgi:hypothetical protein